MKLLLTSNGFSNISIANALKDMAGKPFSKLKLAFIPTAANGEGGDKGWLINDFINCKKLGFASIDIVDICGLQRDWLQERLGAADVLLFGGGHTYYLMHWMSASGVKDMLPELLKTRVYVGISAGSMITAKDFPLTHAKIIYSESPDAQKDAVGLGLVPFYISPHYTHPEFPKARDEYLELFAKEATLPIYALDDQSAVKVDGADVTVISEGKWKKLN